MKRLLSSIAWDGVMPLVVAATPWILRLFIRPGDAMEAIIAIFLPILVAFLRAGIGYGQLQKRTGGTPHWGRQVLLAVAITVLLLFEMAMLMLQFAPDAPPQAWLIPATMYGCYLIVIAVTLPPYSRHEHEEDSGGAD